MIFIVVKFTVRPERSDDWHSLVDDFTAAVRAEPGNLFFEWSTSVDDPNQMVLLEAFADGDAGVAHVNAEHFKTFVAAAPDLVAETPEIINVEVPQDGFGRMGEITPSAR